MSQDNDIGTVWTAYSQVGTYTVFSESGYGEGGYGEGGYGGDLATSTVVGTLTQWTPFDER